MPEWPNPNDSQKPPSHPVARRRAAAKSPGNESRAEDPTRNIGSFREDDPASASFRIACTETAAEWLGVLKPGCRVVGLSKGQFSALDLYRAILAQTGPADVVISAWTAGIQDIEHARYLIDNDVIRTLWWLVDRSFATRQPEYCDRLIDLFGAGCIRASNTHAKFATIRNEEWSVCVRSSANLNRNKRWEQYDVDESPLLCDHFDGLVAELEATTPAGPRPPGSVVEDVFSKALAEATCGDVRKVDMTLRERLSALGYTRTEIEQREARAESSDPLWDGVDQLEDGFREATISAAMGGDAKSRAQLAEWVRDARRVLKAAK